MVGKIAAVGDPGEARVVPRAGDRDGVYYPVVYRLIVYQDETPVRGNAIASDDDAADKAIEDEILERLARDDVWAWATVEMRAECGGFVGRDFLGCCSYRDEDEFKADAYFKDMQDRAFDDLLCTLKAAMSDGNRARKLHAKLRKLQQTDPKEGK